MFWRRCFLRVKLWFANSCLFFSNRKSSSIKPDDPNCPFVHGVHSCNLLILVGTCPQRSRRIICGVHGCMCGPSQHTLCNASNSGEGCVSILLYPLYQNLCDNKRMCSNSMTEACSLGACMTQHSLRFFIKRIVVHLWKKKNYAGSENHIPYWFPLTHFWNITIFESWFWAVHSIFWLTRNLCQKL